MHTYLYAIMAGRHQLDLGQIGLPDGWAHVTTRPLGGLSAVVSESPGISFSELPKPELLRCLTIHQRVIERAMADRPVLPVKFGTLLPSDGEVRTVLDGWQSQLSTTLEAMGDSVEIELAATWDLQRTFAEVARQPDIAVLAATIAGRPAEETVSTRIQIGKLVKEALDHRREGYCQRVVREVQPVVREALSNPLLSDELVLNVAFLVERTSLDEFYARVHGLDEAFEGKLTFRCVGPLPPYSFATVEITQLRPEEIDAARRLLCIGEYASEAEINSSYRRLAARCHPDHNPGDAAASERFAALATAHARLMAYVRSQPFGASQAQEHGQRELAPRAAGTMLALTIRRPDSAPTSGTEANRELDHALV